MKGVRVRVPGSTANLGPGFDCLGLAVGIYLEIYVEVRPAGLEIQVSGTGRGRIPQDDDNLILRAIRQAWSQLGHRAPGLRLRATNGIPLASGLGSSSAAVVAGLLAGMHLAGADSDPALVLSLADGMEGHIDNAAASLLGGLVAVAEGDGQPVWQRYPVAELALTAVIPRVEALTVEMRAVLPEVVPHGAASRNLSRIPFLLEALRTGDLKRLSSATRDELHEPYRLPGITGAAQAKGAGLEAGAAAVVLSGAGPALLAIGGDRPQVGQAMRSAFEVAGVPATVLELEPDTAGAHVSRIDT